MSSLYDYRCSECGIFEARREREDAYTPCPMCEKTAWRLPCSGSPVIIGETVGRATPGEIWRG